MADELLLTPEERLSQLGDILLANATDKDDASKYNRRLLFGQLPPEAFRNEHHIIYKVFYKLKDTSATPDLDYMRMYLTRNKASITGAKRYIDINAYADLDEDPATGYTAAVLKAFNRLKTLPRISVDEFELTIEKYKLEFQALELGNTLGTAKNILYDGIKEGNKILQGYDDCTSYVKKGIADVESIIDTTAGAGFIDSSIEGIKEDNKTKPEKIGDFGLLQELNTYLGGIYTPNFYNIIAPTKGGKSKFTSRMIHNVAVEHGNNVVVWAHEGGHNAWWAQLRAIHFDYIYNRTGDKHMKMSQDMILKDKFDSPAIKELEASSRIDLFTNPEYGKVMMIDRPFKVETFIDEIETAVQLSGAKAVLIDYLQLIGWDNKGMSKSVAIGTAYQKLLAYAKKRNIAVISPAQFTQDFMKELSATKNADSAEVRTAGGESSEIIRTPDINIALYASAEDIRNRTMKILSVPSRMCEPFPSFDIYCDLSVCMFATRPENIQN